MKKPIFYLMIVGVFFSNFALAYQPMLDKVRVFYRPDGGVSVLRVLADSCNGLSIKDCLDRETQKSNLKNIESYDDISESDLPKDRKDRDKWRGEKGRGVWVDKMLTTKSDKIKELNDKLDAELDKNNPNDDKIARLQAKIEKLKRLNVENNILSAKHIKQFKDSDNSSLLASAGSAIGDVISSVLDSIKEGILALRQLVTDTLQVGTSEKPAGITIYDLTNNKPYCLIVKDGKLQNIPGVCGAGEVKEQLSVGISPDDKKQDVGTSTPGISPVATSTINISTTSPISQPETSSSTSATTTP